MITENSLEKSGERSCAFEPATCKVIPAAGMLQRGHKAGAGKGQDIGPRGQGTVAKPWDNQHILGKGLWFFCAEGFTL